LNVSIKYKVTGIISNEDPSYHVRSVALMPRVRSIMSRGAIQVPQEVPDDVWFAYQWLVSLGYDQHLMK
jgi:hypothetical protein